MGKNNVRKFEGEDIMDNDDGEIRAPHASPFEASRN
jgi:hypothetical protein